MYIPLSLPSMKLKTGCNPKMHKKYHEMLDIHRGSMSFVATPACSMLLNLMVRGNGSFTARDRLVSKSRRSIGRYARGAQGDILIT